jgi:DNA-binding HxlR family transcriptional regulator
MPEKKKSYGQYCGLARALEIVGERWGLLIVRDLLVGPRRFSDLHRGLPRIPTNVLSARLKELEDAGVVVRRVLPRPSGSIVYELTDFGNQLEDAVLSLARWGAQVLGDPRSEEIVTVDSLIMAMRSTFNPKAARGLDASYELRVGDVVIHMRVHGAKLEVAAGPLPDADLVIDAGPALKALMAGEMTPARAKASGGVHLKGQTKLLPRFVETFRI